MPTDEHPLPPDRKYHFVNTKVGFTTFYPCPPYSIEQVRSVHSSRKKSHNEGWTVRKAIERGKPGVRVWRKS